MRLSEFENRLLGFASQCAAAENGKSISYADLLSSAKRCREEWLERGLKAGDVVLLESDYSIAAFELLVGALFSGAVVAPLGPSKWAEADKVLNILGPRFVVSACAQTVQIKSLAPKSHPLIARLDGNSGLVVFTSGSSGEPKAVLHDFDRFLNRFSRRGNSYRTLLFLQIDHLGGLSTLFYTWANGGTAVVPGARTALNIAEVVELHRVELLPVTPSFLAQLLASDASPEKLESLKLISYGAETMPTRLLEQLQKHFPRVSFKQTYGLSELGTIPIKSDGIWFIPRFEHRIVDGSLHIRGPLTMIGYLNAPSTVEPSGWMDTGDLVETRGSQVRIIGRRQEQINVGGEKISPLEVEETIREVENINDVVVKGELHPLLGQIPSAFVVLERPECPESVKARIRAHCLSCLASYKVPPKITVVTRIALTDRGKKDRTRFGAEKEAEA